MPDTPTPEPRRKLSATALSCYLESPKAFYWRYVHNGGLEPAFQSVATYDHDKVCGTLWAEFVDRFYKKTEEKENTEKLLNAWHDQTHGWVPEKQKDRLTKALEAWSTTYYQEFSPSDGVRNGSEKYLENERFHGYLDGLSHDGVVHEVKSTSRSPQVAEQLWKVQNSIQVKLYCVLAKASGVIIEFAWKDAPHGIFRAPKLDVGAEQLQQWESELNALADSITALGDDPNKYPCHPDGCCLITKNMVSLCSYSALCSMGYNNLTKICYRPKEQRQR